MSSAFENLLEEYLDGIARIGCQFERWTPLSDDEILSVLDQYLGEGPYGEHLAWFRWRSSFVYKPELLPMTQLHTLSEAVETSDWYAANWTTHQDSALSGGVLRHLPISPWLALLRHPESLVSEGCLGPCPEWALHDKGKDSDYRFFDPSGELVNDPIGRTPLTLEDLMRRAVDATKNGEFVLHFGEVTTSAWRHDHELHETLNFPWRMGPAHGVANPEDVEAILAGGDVWNSYVERRRSRDRLWSANLQEANLEGANLAGLDLWRANLRRVNLRGANLSGAKLKETDFRGADVRNADLSGADMELADVRSSLFDDANLLKVDLRRTRFGNTHLANTKVSQGTTAMHGFDLAQTRAIFVDVDDE